MKTIQITVNESLLRHVDKVITSLKTTRSAFIRDSLRNALASLATKRLEAKHRRGYSKKPVKEDEFSDWENEQVWGDE
jgi:metal-responsive CopG/Arc/MetJ family transcriptional regulator